MIEQGRGDDTRTATRALVAEGRFDDAWALLRGELLAGTGTVAWSLARNLLREGERAGWAPASRRQIRLAVLCTYEAAEFAQQLRLACLALGVGAECYVAPYGQVEQELLNRDSPLAAFAPTHVLIAPTTADLDFPELADDPETTLAEAIGRWRTLWELIRRDHGATVLQHAFVVPDETVLGHLSLRLPASRVSLVRELNRRLAEHAGSDVLLIDCERLAAHVGKRGWIDPRLWYQTRQPVAHDALPVLARETAAVLAADLGLAARCLILDLDNTLWGGVIGEDGIDGIVVGDGPDGEAYTAFQEYVRALHRRGVVLAVASKNDAESARLPFGARGGMKLALQDFAVFVADWRRKPQQIAEIAQTLGLGLDTIVFADDNPAECAEVAAALPEVTTICLDVAPSQRVRLLAASLRFEISSLSREDAARQRSYAARAQAAQLEAQTASIEDFWASLQMRARVRTLDLGSLDRAAQLTQKTNQFNLTLRRHSRHDIESLAHSAGGICRTLELEDRFASHGLVGLVIAVPTEEDPETAVIDTLLLSCRVIGRTAEVHLLSHVSRAAAQQGVRRLRGLYVPGPRNALVADVYPRLGFVAASGNGHCWEYDLAAHGPIESNYIADAP